MLYPLPVVPLYPEPFFTQAQGGFSRRKPQCESGEEPTRKRTRHTYMLREKRGLAEAVGITRGLDGCCCEG